MDLDKLKRANDLSTCIKDLITKKGELVDRIAKENSSQKSEPIIYIFANPSIRIDGYYPETAIYLAEKAIEQIDKKIEDCQNAFNSL